MTSPLSLMLAIMEPPPGLEEEFSDWYDTEHLPQRRALPGFLNAARWICIEGFPRSLAAYDLTSLRALEDPAYVAVSGSKSTPWSRRLLTRTARAGRLRVEVDQVWPGTASFLSPSVVSRLLVARYTGISAEVEKDFVANAVKRADAITGLAQLRLFANRKNGVTEFWLVAEFTAPTTLSALAPEFGLIAGRGADVFNLYVPYDKNGI
jgi:hypothetical protein